MIGPRSLWRTGYDSTKPKLIPATAQLVFPYVPPSQYAWTEAEIDRFPHAAVARITVHGDQPDWRAASIIDVEGNRLDPAHFSFDANQAREFVIARNAFRPGTATVYCDLSHLPGVQAACHGLNWHLWLAHWDNDPNTVPPYPNVVAKQYMHTDAWDRSVVYDPMWHPFKP